MRSDIRKVITSVEDIIEDNGRTVPEPSRKCSVAAVIKNPLAGAYTEDLEPLKQLGAEIAAELVARGLAALGCGRWPLVHFCYSPPQGQANFRLSRD